MWLPAACAVWVCSDLDVRCDSAKPCMQPPTLQPDMMSAPHASAGEAIEVAQHNICPAHRLQSPLSDVGRKLAIVAAAHSER